MRHVIVAVAVAVVVLAAAGAARADDRGKADKLFKQGKKLMADKRYADACQAFEQSFKLDPGIGAQLNIGHCYEEWGKLALAYRSYSRAEQMAKDAHDARVAKIHERIENLDSLVPRLTLNAPDGAVTSDLTITLDGKPFDVASLGKPELVDPGPHQIEYVVAGTKKTKVVPLERGGSSEVMLEVPARVARPRVTPEHEPAREPARVRTVSAPADPGRSRRLAAYVVGGAGLAAYGVSSYLTLSARSSYKDALAQHCMGQTTTCDSTGLAQTHSARTRANIATGVFIGGSLAIAGGLVLYFTAPHARRPRDERALYLAPSLGGFVVGGGF